MYFRYSIAILLLGWPWANPLYFATLFTPQLFSQTPSGKSAQTPAPQSESPLRTRTPTRHTPPTPSSPFPYLTPEIDLRGDGRPRPSAEHSSALLLLCSSCCFWAALAAEVRCGTATSRSLPHSPTPLLPHLESPP